MLHAIKDIFFDNVMCEYLKDFKLVEMYGPVGT